MLYLSIQEENAEDVKVLSAVTILFAQSISLFYLENLAIETQTHLPSVVFASTFFIVQKFTVHFWGAIKTLFVQTAANKYND